MSLDLSKTAPALYQFIKDNNMTWPQIFDGQAAKTPVAAKYGVHAIPCAVLVDGDTGLILATDLGDMGHKLTKALDSALAAKAKKLPGWCFRGTGFAERAYGGNSTST